jgi:hypothetical protein
MINFSVSKTRKYPQASETEPRPDPERDGFSLERGPGMAVVKKRVTVPMPRNRCLLAKCAFRDREESNL